jgi:hypothetical protein
MTDVTMADAAEYKLIIDWIAGEFLDDTMNDLAARRVIAKRLRHGALSLGQRVGLANLLDPDARDVHGWWLVAKRSRGRAKSVDDRRVAAVVQHELNRDPQHRATPTLDGVNARRKQRYVGAPMSLAMVDVDDEKIIINWIAGRLRDGSIDDLTARRATAHGTDRFRTGYWLDSPI